MVDRSKRKTLAWLCGLGLAAVGGCLGVRGSGKPKAPDGWIFADDLQLYSHPAEQVFRDHDGYRAFWTDENDQLQERKYHDSGESHGYLAYNLPFPLIDEQHPFRALDGTGQHIKLFRDRTLDEAVVHVARYTEPGSIMEGQHVCTYVEILLPPKMPISPGNETWGGKFRQDDPMSEIR